MQGQVKAGLGWHPNQLLANKALRRSRMSTTTLRTFMSWSLLAEFFVAWRGRRVTIGKRAPCIQATARHARGCGGIRYHVFFAPMTSIAWVRSRASHAQFQELVKLSFQLSKVALHLSHAALGKQIRALSFYFNDQLFH